MGLLKEFRTFVSRGNVVDLAVGVIMGAAFGKIVTSLVADIIMPPVGMLVGQVNFTDLKMPLGSGTPGHPPVTINYGTFLQATLDFVIIAGAIFLLVQAINRLKRAEAEKPPAVAELTLEEKLLTEIRDLLKTGARTPGE